MFSKKEGENGGLNERIRKETGLDKLNSKAGNKNAAAAARAKSSH